MESTILNTEASVMDANRGHGDNLHLGGWGSGEAYANDIITVKFNINFKKFNLVMILSLGS